VAVSAVPLFFLFLAAILDHSYCIAVVLFALTAFAAVTS
jgi:hypothetical protein